MIVLDIHLDNIQVMSWIENKSKGHHDSKFNRIRSNNTSGVRGVSWHKSRNKWVVHIHHQGKEIHLGIFTNLEQATAIREAAEALIKSNPSISIDKLKQAVRKETIMKNKEMLND